MKFRTRYWRWITPTSLSRAPAVKFSSSNEAGVSARLAYKTGALSARFLVATLLGSLLIQGLPNNAGAVEHLMTHADNPASKDQNDDQQTRDRQSG